MPERRSNVRMLCADLVEVRWHDERGRSQNATVLLEDIAPSGACLQFEAAVPIGLDVRIRCGSKYLDGIVRYCVYQEIGYFVGVEFAPDSQWSREEFEPQHLLDMREMLESDGARDPSGRS